MDVRQLQRAGNYQQFNGGEVHAGVLYGGDVHAACGTVMIRAEPTMDTRDCWKCDEQLDGTVDHYASRPR